MAPPVPKKKRKVSLPENEEVATRIFEKHRSMAAQQPGGLPEHQARALAAAYSGVCAAKEPIRTPGDLARLKGVGGWVVDVMEDSFPGSSLHLSPPRSNTPGETGDSLHDCLRVLWNQLFLFHHQDDNKSSSPSVLSILSSMETGLLLYLKRLLSF